MPHTGSGEPQEDPLAAGVRAGSDALSRLLPADRPSSPAIDSAAALAETLLSESWALPRETRESIPRVLLGIESPEGSGRPCADFALSLARRPATIGSTEIERLRETGASDEQILETVHCAAAGRLLQTLSAGLPGESAWRAAPAADEVPPPDTAARAAGPYVRSVALRAEDFEPFAFLRQRLGFIPAVFRAQTLRPGAIALQARAFGEILLTDEPLTRRQKELVLLAVAAAHSDVYGVALHAEILRALGVPPEESQRVAVDPAQSGILEADRELLDVAVKLAARPLAFGEADRARLRQAGFTPPQILEAIAAAALASFLVTVQAGLGPKPDFRPRFDLLAARREARAALAKAEAEAAAPDPDAEMVASARRGDAAAFEALVRRHQLRVLRTLAGLLANVEDAEDGTQAVFVKVFRKLDDFAGAARFSTWLTRIAIHEGLERLRSRRPAESLEDAGPEDDFRPAHLEDWIDDPESLYAREQLRQIVREELSKLPLRYRTAVLLRDIEQLSSAEAAAALEIPVPTLKTRLLRGRLMLREALAVHFAQTPRRSGPA